MLVTTQAAVLGSPIAHSLSPVVHRAAYAHLGLDWHYSRVELRPDEFDGFVDGLDDSWRGLSITMPLKEQAALCGHQHPDVTLTRVANTVVLDGKREVYNTDISGLADALAAQGLNEVRVATVIGNGATARSAVVALVRSGTKLILVQGRNIDRLNEFRRWAQDALQVEVQPRTLGAPLDPESELLVSTAPSAAIQDHLDTLSVDLCPELRGVFDVVYHPWPTPLARLATKAGLEVVSGLELLAHQGRHQVRLMTGMDVPVEVLLSAVRAEREPADPS